MEDLKIDSKHQNHHVKKEENDPLIGIKDEPISVDVVIKEEDVNIDIKEGDLKQQTEIEGNVVCELCGKHFPNKVKLNSHRRVHVKSVCPKCGKSLSAQTLRKNVHKCLTPPGKPKQDPKTFDCKICGFKAPRRQHLERHMNTHKPKYICTLCERTFVKEKRLKNHMELEHMKKEENQL